MSLSHSDLRVGMVLRRGKSLFTVEHVGQTMFKLKSNKTGKSFLAAIKNGLFPVESFTIEPVNECVAAGVSCTDAPDTVPSGAVHRCVP